MTQASEGIEIGHFPIVGRLVEFEIAAVHDGAKLRAEGDRHHTGDTVVDMDELYVEIANLHALTGADFVQHRALFQAVLNQLDPEQAEG